MRRSFGNISDEPEKTEHLFFYPPCDIMVKTIVEYI